MKLRHTMSWSFIIVIIIIIVLRSKFALPHRWRHLLPAKGVELLIIISKTLISLLLLLLLLLLLKPLEWIEELLGTTKRLLRNLLLIKLLRRGIVSFRIIIIITFEIVAFLLIIKLKRIYYVWTLSMAQNLIAILVSSVRVLLLTTTEWIKWTLERTILKWVVFLIILVFVILVHFLLFVFFKWIEPLKE